MPPLLKVFCILAFIFVVIGTLYGIPRTREGSGVRKVLLSAAAVEVVVTIIFLLALAIGLG